MKKIIKTFAVILCLVLAPFSIMLTGCGKKEETPQEEVTVKSYLTTDETWAIYSEVVNNLKYDQMLGCDNMSITISIADQNAGFPRKIDYCKVNSSFVCYRESINYTTHLESNDMSFKYNDKFYDYNLLNESCEESTGNYTSPKYLFGMLGFEIFSKDNVVSGKVMSNNDYVIIVSSDELGPEFASDSLSFELTLSSNLQLKNFKNIEETGDDIIQTIEMSFTYGTVSVAEMTALVEEAKTHISE